MAGIGLQLYTIADEVARDLMGSLRAVSKIGYDGVEFAKIPTESATQVADALRDLGLTASGVVVPLQQLQDKSALQKAIGYSYEIGSTMILLPWLEEPLRANAEAYKTTAAVLNGIGQICLDHGMRLLYHVHGYEFARFGEQTGLEILMQRCDEELVGLEIDTFWVQCAGEDPLALFRRYAHRCPAIHLKDMDGSPERRDTEVGQGIVDIAGIVNAAGRSASEWFIVEQEKFDRPPLESAAISYRNLRRLTDAADPDRLESEEAPTATE